MDKKLQAQKNCWTLFVWIVVLCAIFGCIMLLPFESSIWIGAIAGMAALMFAAYKAYSVTIHDEGSIRIRELSFLINKGAMTFLSREYRILSVFVIVLFILISKFIDIETAICFICGAICSAVAGYIGMSVSTKANSRTCHAAENSLNNAFQIAFSGGTVMGMAVVGLGLLGLTLLFYFYQDANIVNGFALGGSSIALFARVGGGIYTKAADVGADLVGKVEKGIPEDDHRNPAVIADNVGDNVGDVAGMGADLFESYVGSIIAAITLGAIAYGDKGAFLPIILSGFGIFASLIASYFVKTREGANPIYSLQFCTFGAMVLLVIATYFIVPKILPDATFLSHAVLIGIIAGSLIGVLTQYYTSSDFKPVKNIVKSSLTGSATNIISGLGVGMTSVVLPIILICFAIALSFDVVHGYDNFAIGIYGVALASIGMLATTGTIVAVDAYGPISDNAGGIAEMSGLDKEVRERTDKLDSVGNTTAAIAKGFAIGSAALTALALLCAYAAVVNLTDINLLEPMVIAGLIFGACLPFLFSATTMNAVGRTASKMVAEVRRQFATIKGIMENENKPDYSKCIDISTKGALSEMILPGIMAVLIPILVGLFAGKEALGAMLTGAIVTGVCLAIMMANAGGAWDNAKKYIEEGHEGGKGSAAHCASVVGDTVGDPFKDTSGPSLNILIKLMTIVSLVFATLFI